MTELREVREMRDVGSHNVAISSFHDTRVTLELLDEEVRILFHCR